MTPLASSPTDWRQRYGFDQQPANPMPVDWATSMANGNRQANAINSMPFVLNPQSIGADPAANKQMMYGGGGLAGGMGQGDPLQMILGLLQKNPQVAPMLMQSLSQQQVPQMPAVMDNNSGGL
jgi:hypothetical protein